MKRPLLVVSLVSLSASLSSAAFAQTKASYEQDLKPIIDRACVSCHKAGGSQAARPLTTWAEVAKLKAAVALTVAQDKMPTAGPLPAAEKQKFKEWQDAGFPEKATSGSTAGTTPGSGTTPGAGTTPGSDTGPRPPGSTTTPDATGGQPTPLVLDLGGQGDLEFSPTPVSFDIYATGEPVHVSWPVGKTAFLVLDLNGNGLIDSGAELFGDATALLAAPDRTAEHGFAALAQYDIDHDGTIDASDPVFARLRLWADGNADGKTQAGEIKTLASEQVASLSLGFHRVSRPDGRHTMPLLMGRYHLRTPTGGRDDRVLADVYLRIHER